MTEGHIERLNAALSGRYEIERKLGEGGMASVYLAKDVKHNRGVAIKVLKPELAAVVGAERFLTEIETTANLQHPHILPLFDSGEADGFLFYVMPFVEGDTLGDRIARDKQLPVDEALGIAISVAGALHVAHERGIVHRDIKPGNILLSQGQPLVADFGIALAVGAGGTRLTETGLSVGTPYYMSPEQATGDQAIGPSADIYALACVLFEMLVGEPPYLGNTAQAVLGKIIQGIPVSATAARKSVPAHVDAALRKALEKLPADRFTTSQAFATALADPLFRHGETADTIAAEGEALWRFRAMAASVVAVVFMLGLAWSVTRPAPSTLDLAVSIQMAGGQDLTERETFDVSPDGSFMVYQGPMAEGGNQLWIRRFDELVGRPLVGTEQGWSPEISPDGSTVLFTVPEGRGRRSLATVPVGGGVRRTIGTELWCCGTWGSEGTIYGIGTNQTLVRIVGGVGAVEVVLDASPAMGVRFHPRLLPDESGVVFVSRFANESLIYGLKFGSDEAVLVTNGDYPFVTKSGHLLHLTPDRQLVVSEFDSEAMAVVGTTIPIADSLALTQDFDGHFAIAAETGTILYRTGAGSGTATPVWVDRSGISSPIDEGWKGQYESFALSPDQTQLAVDSAGSSVCVKRLPSGPCQRLTFDGTTNHRPVWSPDGQTIVFASNRAGNERFDLDLYRVRSDASNDPELVWDVPAGTAQAVWLPNGQGLVYRTAVSGASSQTAIGAGDGDIFWFEFGADSATTFRATPSQERSPDLSPDGRWLAYVTNRSGRYEVVIRSFPDGSVLRQVSTAGGNGPMWSKDGAELFFVGSDGMFRVVEITRSGNDLQPGEPEGLFQVEGRFTLTGHHRHYDVTADGERFVFLEVAATGEGRRRELILIENWLENVVARLGNRN